MNRTTEADSLYRHLDKMSISAVLQCINEQDTLVANIVAEAIPQIEQLSEVIIARMKTNGRLFYIGAGTSGRLGVLDASECPPTYGIPEDWVIGIIAGGDAALRKPVEFAEDDVEQGWRDLLAWQINTNDVVVGISASGTTPYVFGALQKCQQMGILTGCITCNAASPIATVANIPIEVVTGPEVVTGSTRMKAGTAQKLVLNMISTATMIGLGRVIDHRMVDMQLSNQKLLHRGANMIEQQLGISHEAALLRLKTYGSVRKAIDFAQKEK